MKLLITGGAGYIGVHTCVELLKKNYKVVIIDNLINSNLATLEALALLTKKSLTLAPDLTGDIIFYQADVKENAILQKIFNEHDFNGVIHFAGLKAVDESNKFPIKYFENNVIGSITLLSEMAKVGLKKLVFSSSATVYGSPIKIPIKEDAITGSVSNPYGRSKYIIEEILKDLFQSDKSWKISILRYFNPVGAHPSGMIGESPKGSPNNLMPYISQVAAKKLKKLYVFGDDYITTDGTGVRDFIHVMDLAKAHFAALNYLDSKKSVLDIFNIGTGKGTSVLELVKTFENISGQLIPLEIIERRPGDVAECWASTEYSEQKLNWKALNDLDQMCRDTWNWELKNLKKNN